MAWLFDSLRAEKYQEVIQKAEEHQKVIQEKIEMPLKKKRREKIEKMLNDLVLEENTAYVFFLRTKSNKRFRIQRENEKPYEIKVQKDNVYVLSGRYGSKVTYEPFDDFTKKWDIPYFLKKPFKIEVDYSDNESKYFKKDIKTIQAKINAFNKAKEEKTRRNTTFF